VNVLSDEDPLSDLPPPRADAESLRQTAARYGQAAASLERAAGQIRQGMADTVGQSWIGQAATATAATGNQFADGFQAGARYATEAADALRAGATAWDTAAGTYRQARALADEALADEQRHRAHQTANVGHDLLSGNLGGLLGDSLGSVGLTHWHSPLRHQARAAAQAAIDDVNAAASRCAQRLNESADQLGAPPPAAHHRRAWWEHGPVGWAVDETARAAGAVGHGLEDAASVVADNAEPVGRTGVDLLGVAAGGGLMLLGGGAEAGGLALDASGVGAVGGVVLNGLGVAAIAAGATTAGVFTARTAGDVSDLISESRSKKEIQQDPGYGARPSKPGRTPRGAQPYKARIANRVPPWGQNGPKTTGVFDAGTGRPETIVSGYGGPADLLPKPRAGMPNNLVSHVEANAAARMRLDGVTDGTLYINRLPCAGRMGCDNLLPRMIPTGSRLTIYGPDGYVRLVEGRG